MLEKDLGCAGTGLQEGRVTFANTLNMFHGDHGISANVKHGRCSVSSHFNRCYKNNSVDDLMTDFPEMNIRPITLTPGNVMQATALGYQFILSLC